MNNLIEILKQVKAVILSSETSYKIAEVTGLSRQTLSLFRNGKSSIEKAPYTTIIKLYLYSVTNEQKEKLIMKNVEARKENQYVGVITSTNKKLNNEEYLKMVFKESQKDYITNMFDVLMDEEELEYRLDVGDLSPFENFFNSYLESDNSVKHLTISD